MSIGTFRATVSRVKDLTHDVRELELTLLDPATISFKAGQFVSFEVAKPGVPYPVTRPYSIASPPSVTDRITLLYNLVKEGPGSTYLHGLKEGDVTSFKGPAGSFYLRDEPAKHLLFVATGTGIAPFVSMLRTLFTHDTGQPITLFWGLRYERDLYYQEELTQWAADQPSFRFVTTLSQPGPSWRGSIGRVTGLVQERIRTVSGLSVYLCGNGAMLNDVTTVIQGKGLCPIYREKYY
jgi:NAD(P)H-flavin reductase